MIRRLIGATIFILLILLSVEIAFSFLAQWAASRYLKQKYYLSKAPSVSISSFPIIYSLSKGNIRNANVTFEGEYLVGEGQTTGFPVQINIFARDIKLNWTEVLSGNPSIDFIGELRSFALIDEHVLNDYLSFWGMEIECENGFAYVKKLSDSSKKYLCKVKVKSDKVVDLIISKVSTSNLDFPPGEIEAENSEVLMVDLSALPEEFHVQNACIKRDNIFLYIFISGLERAYK